MLIPPSSLPVELEVGVLMTYVVEAKFDGGKLMDLVHRNQSPYARAVVHKIW